MHERLAIRVLNRKQQTPRRVEPPWGCQMIETSLSYFVGCGLWSVNCGLSRLLVSQRYIIFAVAVSSFFLDNSDRLIVLQRYARHRGCPILGQKNLNDIKSLRFLLFPCPFWWTTSCSDGLFLHNTIDFCRKRAEWIKNATPRC